MRETYLSGNFKANFPFNFAGGIPVDRHPDNSGMGGGDILGTDDGQQSDDGHTEGEEQDDPDDNDIDSLDLQGLIDKALLAIDVALMGLSILGILFPEPTTSAAGAAGLAALLAKLRRLRALKAAAKAAKGKFKFPKFPKPKTPKPKFPKPKTPKGKTKPFDPTKRPDGKPFTDPRTGKPIKPKTPVRPDGKPLDPLPTNKPTTKRPFTPGGSNTRAQDLKDHLIYLKISNQINLLK
ncbi:MAG: hypothetical protein CM15mL4_0860 [uncultured marine virus]|nr:MAG: hypothetical protein CM15mL4_0860 [uncultured marine virus]